MLKKIRRLERFANDIEDRVERGAKRIANGVNRVAKGAEKAKDNIVAKVTHQRRSPRGGGGGGGWGGARKK